MSTLNPNITHVMIDGALFKDEVESRQIMAVPTVFLNGEHFGQGRMTLAEIVNKIDSGAAERKAAELNEKAPYEVLIVGGGRSEEHTSELQSRPHLVCRLLL